MKKKNAVCIALTAVMALSAAMTLAACGKTADPNTPEPPVTDGAAVYPEASYLDPFYRTGGTLSELGAGANSTHDPVIVEAKSNGSSVYYAFSTDNDEYGVQIRKSANLYE